MTNEKTIPIPETVYAQLMAQASILRTVVHALGGYYEIKIDALQKHGHGPMDLDADPVRQVISIRLAEPEDEKLKEMRKAAMEAATRHKRTT